MRGYKIYFEYVQILHADHLLGMASTSEMGCIMIKHQRNGVHCDQLRRPSWGKGSMLNTIYKNESNASIFLMLRYDTNRCNVSVQNIL